MKNAFREYLDFSIETALQAGKLVLRHFQKGVLAEFKADHSPVTIADRESEELIRSRIEKCYPNHAIVGEEFGTNNQNSSSEFRWFIDPIDGTKSFIRGVPLFAVLIGLEIDGRCEVGVAYFPALSEMVYAASGLGCYLNGRRIQVSDTENLNKGYISFADPASFEKNGREKAWQNILKAGYYRTGWSDAYGHALVATGRLELMLDPVMNPWDCAPFPPILREAGGFFGDWSGRETIYGGEAISTTRKLLPEVLDLLNAKPVGS